MSTTRVTFSEEARKSLLEGMSIVSDAVGTTLGPRGKLVLIQQRQGNPIVTKDGVRVSKAIRLKDPLQRMGAALIQEAASMTNDFAGDGTTTSTILAFEMANEGAKYLNAGIPAVKLIEGINIASGIVTQYIRETAIQVRDDRTLQQVATISANNDAVIGQLIAQAFQRVGRNGIITVEDAKGTTTSLEVAEGMQFERGFLSPYFVTDSEKMRSIYENAAVLVTDRKISQLGQILGLLEKVQSAAIPLLIIAEDVDGEALQGLVVNASQGAIRVCAVRAPGYGDTKHAMLKDICVLTGATLISPDEGNSLEKACLKDLGRVKKFVVERGTTTLVGTGKTKDAINERVAELATQLHDMTLSREAIDQLKTRSARLSDGVAVVRVGGATEIEMIERKHRVEDALHATRAAMDEGILPGGGIALVRASHHIDLAHADRDIMAGIAIVMKACVAPFRKIVSNAGHSPDVMVHDVVTREDIHERDGYDALNSCYVDMIKAGIIDPAKVGRLAIKHAASVACTFLNLDAVVIEDEEEKDAEER